MKLKGKRPGIHRELVVLPREDGDLVFYVRAIEDFEGFEKLCPPPTPPAKILPGDKRVENPLDPAYLELCSEWGVKRLAYMVIKGLTDGTPDLEWEKVKVDDNTTWVRFRDELRDSGLSDIEINRLVAATMVANSLSEQAIDAARKRFLASLQVPENLSLSQNGEQNTSSSGEPANVSV